MGITACERRVDAAAAAAGEKALPDAAPAQSPNADHIARWRDSGRAVKHSFPGPVHLLRTDFDPTCGCAQSWIASKSQAQLLSNLDLLQRWIYFSETE